MRDVHEPHIIDARREALEKALRLVVLNLGLYFLAELSIFARFCFS